MSVLVLSESENEGEQLLEEMEDENFVEPRLADERANVPVSVVTERFLRAILDKVPLDRIEELHLFSPLRQGTVETGIAVVAARVLVVDEVTPPAPLELEFENAVALEEAADVAEVLEHEREMDVEDSVEIERDEVEALETNSEHIEAEETADDSPYADEPVQLKLVTSSEHADAAESDDAAAFAASDIDAIAGIPVVPRVRHTVYTARYRLIVKGPERGKWEMDVVDEADAPLLAVETVVRGVQRRAGEETATVRYDASQLARVLRLPLPE